MPICDKPTSSGNLSASELDHHASEAAKVKRTKEQAYFNSYDFDAIEVLPYEEEDDEEVHAHQHHHHHHHPKYTLGGCKTCHQTSQSASVSPVLGVGPASTLPTVSHSHSLNSRQHQHQQPPQQQHQQQQKLKKKKMSSSSHSHSSSTNSSLSSFSHRNNGAANSKRTYLKRIGAFFTSQSMGKRASIESLADIEQQVQQTNTSSASSSQISLNNNIRSVGKLYDGISDGSNKRDHVIDDVAVVNSNFLLPRAMLKYQSVGFGNSMPLSVISNLGGSSTSLKSNSIGAQLNQVSIGSKSQQIPVESSISATDAASIVNLKKPPNPIAAAENSGFVSSPLSACSTLLATKSLLSAESSIIGETSANVHVSGAPAFVLAIAGAPVASKSITNPNVVSSITSDLQKNYNEKLALSSSSSSSSSSTTAIVAVAVGGGSRNSAGAGGGGGVGTPSSSSSVKTGGSGNAVATTRHSSTGRGARERTSSQSHYSTDKSGSSGYYSSNVCSTYSVEDHIYCEPVIDILEGNKSATLKTVKLGQQSGTGPRKIMIVHNSDDDDEDHLHHRPHDHYRQQQHIKQNLRILENSIETLDRHLKNYPKLTAQDRIASFVQTHTQPPNVFQAQDVAAKNRNGHLPTIMEGGTVDGKAAASSPKTWQEEIADDSLLDIDLDSFLLVTEGKVKGGIDNPNFNKSEVLHDEDMENNYKCAKYINSCPEDAYRLESEVGSSLDHFLKKYEDQIHFQNTRELLEDVRDKIRLLSSEGVDSSTVIGRVMDKHLPGELDSMIKALKSELESYLERMNHHSEMEIRQLCTGLVKNQNIVKMKKAFDRRKSNASDPEYDFAYEAIRESGTIVTVQHTRQHIDTTSIRCTSDPNFKMKRKSLCEIFPTTDAACYVGTSTGMVTGDIVANGGGAGVGITDQSSSVLNDGATAMMTRTQMQRNLSFHKPILNKLGSETPGDGDKDSILDWHRKKPSIWEMYYGTNRMNQTLLGKRGVITNGNQAMSYPSSRPESDFTLDLPRAEQLRIKMEKEKKFRRRCRYLTTFLSLVFFLLTVMVVSLVLTRGKRMFGSMI